MEGGEEGGGEKGEEDEDDREDGEDDKEDGEEERMGDKAHFSSQWSGGQKGLRASRL